MEEAIPKVHRHRRASSRHRRRSQQQQQQQQLQQQTQIDAPQVTQEQLQQLQLIDEIQVHTISTEDIVSAVAAESPPELVHRSSSDGLETTTTTTTTNTTATQSQSSQQTVLLVNGHAPPVEVLEDYEPPTMPQTVSNSISNPTTANDPAMLSSSVGGATAAAAAGAETDAVAPDSPTQHAAGGGGGGGGGSSRNSSGDAMSLRETLQKLPTRRAPQEVDSSFHRGILGYMDREMKQSSPTPSALSAGKPHSLSDPQASPAQRSLRSRNSLEKSPRRKRSKSESRRRRERKLIAAGEMEVRQANETLMRYLKQCSEMNDASLSGELEIDKNFDERRVHRKTKSQRDKRGHLMSKLYSAGGLSSLLRELSDDIVPADGEEIYNPFTPVVSPTEDTPAHIDKMFLQTSSGYRPVEHCYYGSRQTFVGGHSGASGSGLHAHATTSNGAGGSGAGGAGGSGVGSRQNGIGIRSMTAGMGMRASGSCGDTRCLLEGGDCRRHEITTKIQLACFIQRTWLLISNICHGLLAGLALAHLLFVLSSHPIDWSHIINDVSLAGETITNKDNADDNADTTMHPPLTSVQTLAFMEDYAAFAGIYLNTFYCLAIVCLVSVFDRMDICHWDISNATEFISFRWLIIAMIYIATIILTICSDSIDERLYFNKNVNVTLTQKELISNGILSAWSSLSVTRSIAAISGWIMIGLSPHEDMLYEHLLDLSKYQLTNN